MIRMSTKTDATRYAGISAEKSRKGRLELRGVSHHYDGVQAIDGVNLTIEPGEFFTLLGASGSGKSTILQLVAGLQQPTDGTILLDGAEITTLPPQRRDVGMVFQNYALFPHMTVAQNVAFPLEVRKVSRAEVEQRVDEMLRLVDLTEHRDRSVSALSGGQQQRVAIARSLAAVPRVLLLDEPLGALDRRLREQLSTDLRGLQERSGVTAIYVTHDQVEAFTMSDRVAIVDRGRLVQIGTPRELYNRPRNRFVAQFVGDANVLEGMIASSGPGSAVLTTSMDTHIAVPTDRAWSKGEHAALIVRPENVLIEPAGLGATQRFAWGRVRREVFLGDCVRVDVDTDGGSISVRAATHAAAVRAGDEVDLSWRTGTALLVSDESR